MKIGLHSYGRLVFRYKKRSYVEMSVWIFEKGVYFYQDDRGDGVSSYVPTVRF